MDQFVSFRKFSNLEQARMLEELLFSNNIENRLIENKSSLDGSFSTTLLNDYEIKIKHEDFIKAVGFMESHAVHMFNNIDKDYYLLSFNDDELYDIILKKDEWNEFDYLLAKKLLADRGKVIDDELLKDLRKQRLDDLAKPEPEQPKWVIIGYLSAFFGGLLGLIIGYLLWTSKKTLPNGEKVYSYSEFERRQGKRIFIIGAIIFPIVLMSHLIK